MSSLRNNNCPNCQHKLSEEDNYCSNCGQKNHQLNISVKQLLHDFIEDYFTFDSKLFKSLKPIVLHPGLISKEFMEGKRAKYIPPLRILLFMSFIYFLIWDINLDLENNESKLVANFSNKGISFTSPSDTNLFHDNKDSIFITTDSNSTTQQTKLVLMKKMAEQGYSPKEIVDSLVPNSSFIMYKFLYQANKLYQADIHSFIKYAVGNVSIIILLMQPFFALILLLLFFNSNKSKYISHLVFALYYHAFLLLLLCFYTVLTHFYFSWILGITLPLIAFFYLYKAIRKFYEQKRWSSLWKLAVLLGIYLMVMLPTFTVVSFLASFFFF